MSTAGICCWGGGDGASVIPLQLIPFLKYNKRLAVALKSESISRSVVSNSLWPHGL